MRPQPGQMDRLPDGVHSKIADMIQGTSKRVAADALENNGNRSIASIPLLKP
jgi:hypothetical protein